MRLVVSTTGAQLPLSGRQEYLIGREDPISGVFPDADLTPHGADAGGVSRQHARITVQGGQAMIEDLNSTNGTWVNRAKIQSGQPTPLSDGAEIRLGRVALIFYSG
jgi:pSer/pThr/pTyr-binding forkhead associated (FHA) protein